MSSELSRFLKSLDKHRFEVADHVVTCWFGRKDASRRHAVRLKQIDDGISLEATVATAKNAPLDFAL